MKMDLDKFIAPDLQLWRMVHFMTEGMEPTIKAGRRFYYMCYDFEKHPERIQAVNDAIRGRLGGRLVKITRHRLLEGSLYFTAKISYYEH
jgi:hypothetical protein